MFLSSKLSAVLVTVVVCMAVHVTLGQQQPGQLGPCSSGLEGELPVQCLESNGIDYNGTLFIISGNRTGALPQGISYSGFRDLMCSPGKQDQVTPCILQLMQKWNRSECTAQDRLIMAARGGQLLALMEGFCGDPCEQAAMQTLIQCFAAVQVDPSPILNQNATIVSDKFSFVGNDSASATNFCNSRQRLFSCLSPLSTQCPKIMERLYTLGIDLEGMERATKVLCDDLDSYLKAYTCFAKPTPAIQQCTQEVDLLFIQVQEERYRTGQTTPSQYQGRLCQTKLSKVDCELRNYVSTCGADSTELLSAYECTSMPKPCRTGSETLPVYQSLCKKVTTPPPTVTVRPTPPPRPTKPGSGPGNGGNNNNDDNDDVDNGVDAVAGSLRVALVAVVVAAVVLVL